MSNLPLLFVRGQPTSLECMSLEELQQFLRYSHSSFFSSLFAIFLVSYKLDFLLLEGVLYIIQYSVFLLAGFQSRGIWLELEPSLSPGSGSTLNICLIIHANYMELTPGRKFPEPVPPQNRPAPKPCLLDTWSWVRRGPAGPLAGHLCDVLASSVPCSTGIWYGTKFTPVLTCAGHRLFLTRLVIGNVFWDLVPLVCYG